MAKFRLTRPIWLGDSRLEKGAEVEFDGEPTGVYRGRCEPIVEAAKADKPKPPPAPAK